MLGRRDVAAILVLSFVPVVVSCTPHANIRDSVITQSRSPDSETVAYLVRRNYQAALNADIEHLIIAKSLPRTTQIMDLASISAMDATGADKVELSWSRAGELTVTCNRCGLVAIDIMKKLDHFGTTKIYYVGFPQHTAYD